ncbi:hypothetical protein Tco_1153290 [Tanacetum coccineum]
MVRRVTKKNARGGAGLQFMINVYIRITKTPKDTKIMISGLFIVEFGKWIKVSGTIAPKKKLTGLMLPYPYSNLDPECSWYEMLGSNKLETKLVLYGSGLLEHRLELVLVGLNILDIILDLDEYNKVEYVVGLWEHTLVGLVEHTLVGLLKRFRCKVATLHKQEEMIKRMYRMIL